MSYTFDSRLGEQLYQLLPEVYRTRDKMVGQVGAGSGDEDLAKYLDAHGYLLDQIHATLEQQLKDALPESSQDWLLPYFAQLLAANTVSPEPDGRHAEISHAVSWRQRKGTLKCVEEIAEAVGQMEVEFQEGWKRVAMTPRIGMPLMPAKVWDDRLKINMSEPAQAIRHPSIPASMIDLRRPSRAVEAKITNPAARLSSFAGVKQNWRQSNLHGAPCFPDSYEDVSRRTVDLRTASIKNGHYHHKRLLAYAPPPTGLFPLDTIQLTWSERSDYLHEHLIEEKEVGGICFIRNLTDRVLEITDDVTLEEKMYQLEGINFLGELTIPNKGIIEMSRVEAGKLTLKSTSIDESVLTATDCLYGELSSGGLVKLDSCTVLETAYLTSLQAINCIFMTLSGTDISGVIEYSRIPVDAPLSTDTNRMRIKSHQPNEDNPYGFDPVNETPSFIPDQSMLAARAALSPSAPESIYSGASDHSEMGYFHRGRIKRPIKISGDPEFSLPENGGYPLMDIIFQDDISVNSGQLALVRCAAPTLSVDTSLNSDGEVIPSLSAIDCLFQNINVESGLARLEYCTVMQAASCLHLQASDCIFAGTISEVKKQNVSSSVDAFLNCLRYSSIPSVFLDGIKVKPESHADKKLARALQLIDAEGNLTLRTNTFEAPVFDEFCYCKDQPGLGPLEQIKPRKADYGEYGYGVPGLFSPRIVRLGAEDGGEMGAYHHRYYALKTEAMLDKMREFLPVGIEPVIIFDTRLLHVPPDDKNLSIGGTS